MCNAENLSPILAKEGSIELLDVTALPGKIVYNSYTNVNMISQAIAENKCLGPGAICALAALAIRMQARKHANSNSVDLFSYTIQEALFSLKAARPKSVPLAAAIMSFQRHIENHPEECRSIAGYLKLIENFTDKIVDHLIEADRKISGYVERILPDSGKVLLVGASGALSSVGCGTNIQAVRCANAAGKKISLICPVSYPMLVGQRLHAYELEFSNISYEVVSDASLFTCIASPECRMVLIAGSGIFANGDVISSVGANSAACIAKYFGKPVCVSLYGFTTDIQQPDGRSYTPEMPGAYEVLTDKLLENSYLPITGCVPGDCIDAYVSEFGVFRPGHGNTASDYVGTLADAGILY